MGRKLALFAFAFLLTSQPVWARTAVHEAAESPQYGRKAAGMVGRGLLNAVTCFVDVIVHLVNDTKAGPPLIGTLEGVAKGAGCGVLRLGSGAVDLVTFWVPGFNGFPVSDSYNDCLAGMSTASAQAPQAPAYAPAVTTFAPAEPTAAQAETTSQTAQPAAESHPARKWSK